MERVIDGLSFKINYGKWNWISRARDFFPARSENVDARSVQNSGRTVKPTRKNDIEFIKQTCSTHVVWWWISYKCNAETVFAFFVRVETSYQLWCDVDHNLQLPNFVDGVFNISEHHYPTAHRAAGVILMEK